VILEKSKPKISLASMKVEDRLVFSEPTLYEIYDIYGRIVFKGYDDSVNVKGLERGEYYLNFDNQMSVFTKQ
jgi:phage terminase large subunit